jgi:toxin FitB
MFVLDTNVVAELRKVKAGKADPNVAAWNESVTPSQAFVSVVTVLELERGILQIERRDAAQGAVLRRWMDEHVMPAFDGRVLAIDASVARRCAKLHAPDPKPERDAFIASTALVHGMTVVTRNVEDFVLTGVEVLNPWEWEPGHITLHREMEDILRKKGNKWMTSAEVAATVNRRGRYRKRKGTEIQSAQVAGRARQYDKIFECRSEGPQLQIRLRRGL